MGEKQKKGLIRILSAAAVFLTLLILEHTGALPFIFGNRWLSLLCYLAPYLAVCLSYARRSSE